MSSQFQTIISSHVDDALQQVLEHLSMDQENVSQAPVDHVLSMVTSDVLKLRNESVLQTIGDAISSFFFQQTGFRYKRNGKYLTKSSGTKLRFICCNSGQSIPTVGSLQPNPSTKCGCAAGFEIWAGGIDLGHLNHVAYCTPLSQDARAGSSRSFQDNLRLCLPEIEDQAVCYVSERLSSDFSTRPASIMDGIARMYEQALVSLPEEKRLRLPSNPPDAWKRKVLDHGTKHANHGIGCDESLDELVRTLKNTPEDYPFDIHMAPTHTGKMKVKSIFFSIKREAPQDLAGCSLFMADVTHGLCDSRAGPHKVSFISAVDEAHNIRPVIVSMVESEDADTFEQELLFFLKLDPTLLDRKVIFLVDGDRGRIKAIRKVLKNALIFLCLWHKQQNVKKHFRGVVKSAKGKSKQESGKGPTVAEIKQILKVNKIGCKGLTRKADLLALLAEATEVGHIKVGHGGDNLVDTQSTSTLSSVNEAVPGNDRAVEESSDSSEDDDDPPQEDDAPTQEDDHPIVDNIDRGARSSQEAKSPTDADLPPSYTFYSSFAIFQYLASGATLDECDRRLDVVKAKYPETAEYIDNELRPNKELWAHCTRVWKLTFGLVATTLQENLHWSLKAALRGRSVLPHRLPDFVMRVLAKRRLRTERKQKVDSKLKTSLEDVVRMQPALGHSAEQVLSVPGLRQLVASFKFAVGSRVSELATDVELRAAIQSSDRGASAARFDLLLASSEAARFLSIHLPKCEVHDVVAILHDGSLACTCGQYAATGMVCPHICAAFDKRGLQINLLRHVHGHWLKEKSPVAVEHVARLECSTVVSSQQTHLSESPLALKQFATWDRAVVITDEAWEAYRLGGSHAAVNAMSHSVRQHERIEPKPADVFKEVMRSFQLYWNENTHDDRKEIQDLAAKLTQKREATAELRASITGCAIRDGTVRRTNSTRARMAADHSKRARRGGKRTGGS